VSGRDILKGKFMTTKKQYKRFLSAPKRFRLFGFEIRIARLDTEWKYQKKIKADAKQE
jgi:hypothetical protein